MTAEELENYFRQFNGVSNVVEPSGLINSIRVYTKTEPYEERLVLAVPLDAKSFFDVRWAEDEKLLKQAFNGSRNKVSKKILKFINTPFDNRSKQYQYYLVLFKDKVGLRNYVHRISCGNCYGNPSLQFTCGPATVFWESEIKKFQKMFPYFASAFEEMKVPVNDQLQIPKGSTK